MELVLRRENTVAPWGFRLRGGVSEALSVMRVRRLLSIGTMYPYICRRFIKVPHRATVFNRCLKAASLRGPVSRRATSCSASTARPPVDSRQWRYSNSCATPATRSAYASSGAFSTPLFKRRHCRLKIFIVGTLLKEI